jgi:phage anti-repressor protein
MDTKLIDKNIQNLIKIEFQKLLENADDGYIISLESLCEWLECYELYEKYISDAKYRENLNAKTLRVKLYETNDENDITYDFIMRKSGNINIPWFSVDGFKQFCMFSKNAKSILVRRYYIKMEKDYRRALRQSKVENKKELEKLEKDIKISKNSTDNKQVKLEVWQKENDKLLLEVNHLNIINKKAKRIAPIIYDKDNFNAIGKADMKELMMLRKKHMKEVSVYIVNSEVFNKKVTKSDKKPKSTKSDKSNKKMLGGVFSDSDSSDENKESSSSRKNIPSNIKIIELSACRIADEYTKNFDEYTFDDIKEVYDPLKLYYCIGGINSVEKNMDNYYKICTIYVLDKEHLKDIKDELNDDEIKNGEYKFKTSKKDIYVMSYDQLEEIRSKHLDNRHCDNIRKEFE